MSKEAMKLALEALIRSRKAVSGDLDLAGCAYGSNDPDGHRYDDAKQALVTLDKAITALREALAEQPAPSQYGSPELQAMIVARAIDKDKSEQPAQQEPKKDLMWSTVAMQERHDQRIQKVVATLERIKQEQLAEQPAQQEPWGACVHGRVFVGRLPDHVRKFSEDEGMPIQWLYTSPQPAQPAQPAQQEPVAKDDADIYEFWARNKETERQQKPMAYGKPWVGLDHDDIHALMNEYFYEGMQPSAIHFANFARAIEAKLKEKNT